APDRWAAASGPGSAFSNVTSCCDDDREDHRRCGHGPCAVRRRADVEHQRSAQHAATGGPDEPMTEEHEIIPSALRNRPRPDLYFAAEPGMSLASWGEWARRSVAASRLSALAPPQ